MKNFEREEKYLVFKIKDLEKLEGASQRFLRDIASMVNMNRHVKEGKDPIECVVVEHDWPMYEDVWSMIQQYVETGEYTELDEIKAKATQEKLERLYRFNEYVYSNKLYKQISTDPDDIEFLPEIEALRDFVFAEEINQLKQEISK